MADSEVIKNVRVGQREIGHDELSQQQSRKHRAVDDPTRAFFVRTQRHEPALLNRGFDRLVVDLIEIDDHAAFQIRFLTKWHVDKTEGVRGDIVIGLPLRRR